MKKILFILVLVFFPFISMYSEGKLDDTYITPNRLFHIARSVNRNLVCYDVNLKNGKLDAEHPLNVYWINREEHPGEREGLNYIQRKMAYGYKVVTGNENTCVCTLTAYPSRRLTITRKGTAYTCFITINNKKAVLQSLYVKAKPNNPLSVEYVELTGVAEDDGQTVSEKVKK